MAFSILRASSLSARAGAAANSIENEHAAAVIIALVMGIFVLAIAVTVMSPVSVRINRLTGLQSCMNKDTEHQPRAAIESDLQWSVQCA
jgi:hypothetical protein